jgi:hypothetical protein
VTVTSVGLPSNQAGTTTFTHEPIFTVTEGRTPLEPNVKLEQGEGLLRLLSAVVRVGVVT